MQTTEPCHGQHSGRARVRRIGGAGGVASSPCVVGEPHKRRTMNPTNTTTHAPATTMDRRRRRLDRESLGWRLSPGSNAASRTRSNSSHSCPSGLSGSPRWTVPGSAALRRSSMSMGQSFHLAVVETLLRRPCCREGQERDIRFPGTFLVIATRDQLPWRGHPPRTRHGSTTRELRWWRLRVQVVETRGTRSRPAPRSPAWVLVRSPCARRRHPTHAAPRRKPAPVRATLPL